MRSAGCKRDHPIRYGGVERWLGIQHQVLGSANFYGSGPEAVDRGCWGSASEEPGKRKTQVGEGVWLVLVQLLALAALRLAGQKTQRTNKKREEERQEAEDETHLPNLPSGRVSIPKVTFRCDSRIGLLARFLASPLIHPAAILH